MRALILAAGFGKRLQESWGKYEGKNHETVHTWLHDADGNFSPKGLLKVHGKPLVSYHVQQLRHVGIALDDIYVHTNSVSLPHYQRWAESIGIPIRNVWDNDVYQYEDRLEQVGDLLHALGKLGTDEPTLLFACDTLLYNADQTLHDLSDMVLGYRQDGYSRVAVWPKGHDLSRHGIVEVHEDSGIVTGFEEKPENPKSNLVCVSLYLFSPGKLQEIITRREEFPRRGNVMERIYDGFKIEMVAHRRDFGTIADLLALNGLEADQ
jgi:dTDP-glucose pyrophosphorylase